MSISIEQQAARREELYVQHRALLHQITNPDGTFLEAFSAAPDDPRTDAHAAGNSDPRTVAWHCFAALSGNEADIRLGNAVLRQTDFLPSYDFFASALISLMLRFHEKLEPDVLARAEDCLQKAGPSQMRGCGFVGMNDNFAAMEVTVLVLVGEWTGRDELVQCGIDKMKVLIERLDRFGTYAEFNSPTYTPITLACMAEIVNYTKSEAARDAALRIEEQTWRDLCARYHPATSQMSGPTSRSYMGGSCGHVHNGRFLLHVAFGEAVQPLSPLRYAYGKEKRLVVHHLDIGFVAANGAWIAAPTYHIPEECAAWVTGRVYPFHVVGTAGVASLWHPDEWRVTEEGREATRIRPFEPHVFSPVRLETWQNEKMSLGTSSGPVMCRDGGQHDAFFLNYLRTSPDNRPLAIEDVRCLFSRYLLNDDTPSTNAPSNLLADRGYKTVVQDRNAALVLYRPSLPFPSGLTRMRLSVVLPLHCNAPDEIRMGDVRLAGLEGESETPVPVFVRDEEIYLAFHPLMLSDYGRHVAVSLTREDDFCLLNFWNYDGPARSLNFSQMGALFTQNGFAVEAFSASDWDSFDAFCQAMQTAEISDTFVAGMREVRYLRQHVELRIRQDIQDEVSIPDAWIGAAPRETPDFFVQTGSDR